VVVKNLLMALACAFGLATTAAAADRALLIYFIDVEGGQSTLIVTPDRHALLIDTGYAGNGTFESKPGDPQKARDANRILAAARDAGVSRIDALMITHFHADHDGGVTELSQLIPIATFVDHDHPLPEVESVKGSLLAFDWYKAVRDKGRHVYARPGDRLPVKGIDALVVSSERNVLAKPLKGAGKPTAGCAAPVPTNEPNENPRSTGVLLTYGRFRFLDIGDLSAGPLFKLACPADLIGAVDVYLVAHHGNDDAADPSTFAAFRPRVAIVNNGEKKGGGPKLLAMLRGLSGTDAWQLHRAATGQNLDDARIANVDETTSHWIKVSASRDGSFTVTNARTGASQRYAARR
jgi:beta-lactamase superfamily II metal-dependent hydrolase